VSTDRTWWGRQWLHSVEQRAQLDPNRLPRARRYARSGAIGDLQIGPGEARATVAGRGSRPYAIRIRVRPLTDDEWRRVLEAVAARATYSAALLEGDLPPEVAAALEESGLALVPGPAEIGPRCSCPDDADPCKHSAAVCFSIADTLDADPFVMLLLRGRSRDEVLAGIRTLRREPGADERQVDDEPPVVPEDPGVDAREVLAAREWGPVPDPPAPPRRPGRPAAWPVEPPAELAGLRADLMALAADAVHRAWELAVGAAPDARLALDADTDLARRADRALGKPAFAVLAARAHVPERELARWALAWRHGGAVGLETLRRRWNPAEEGEAGTRLLLVAARTALNGAAPAARIRGDRVTAGGRQLRLGRDDRWYPYQRVRDQWEPAGPAATDPAVAVARAWPQLPVGLPEESAQAR
jgi:uncharacterized Zn finger protein